MSGYRRLGGLGRFAGLNPAAHRYQENARAPYAGHSTPFALTRSLHTFGSEQQLRRDSVADLQKIQAPELAPRNIETAPFANAPTVPIRDELKYSNFSNVPLNIGTASVRVLLKPPTGSRRVYLMIVNTSAAGNFFVSFGQDATLLNGVPILPNFGAYEFNNTIPQDDIYIIASGAAVTGVIVYSNDTVIGVQQ